MDGVEFSMQRNFSWSAHKVLLTCYLESLVISTKTFVSPLELVSQELVLSRGREALAFILSYFYRFNDHPLLFIFIFISPAPRPSMPCISISATLLICPFASLEVCLVHVVGSLQGKNHSLEDVDNDPLFFHYYICDLSKSSVQWRLRIGGHRKLEGTRLW